MSPARLLPAEPASRPCPQFDRRSQPQSLWALQQRLARAEDELRIQFSRIAQLQAELDRVLALLRRAPGSANPR